MKVIVCNYADINANMTINNIVKKCPALWSDALFICIKFVPAVAWNNAENFTP